MKTTSELADFRKEAREWLDANCPDSMRKPMKSFLEIYWGGKNASFTSDDQKVWFERCQAKQWTVPHWPEAYGGGGLTKQEHKVLKQEMNRLGCRPPLYNFGISMLGPALLKFGNDAQKDHFLSMATAGKLWWCQGYSEPGAGSDLANIQTRAEDMGDHYVVNGQKVWTSYADRADWIFCLVRTSAEGRKQAGISFLLIDMETEGVSTRPIQLISGKSPFCETFFDNVKVPKENLVGVENQGWTIAKYLLTHEREMIGSLGEMGEQMPLHKSAIEYVGTDNGKLKDSVLRPEVARWSMNDAVFKMTLSRSVDEIKKGQSLGANSSFFKYYGTELNKQKYELLMSLSGMAGCEWEGLASNEGEVGRAFLRTKGNSIEGGTSEVQLNIIAKHILGLPSK